MCFVSSILIRLLIQSVGISCSRLCKPGDSHKPRLAGFTNSPSSALIAILVNGKHGNWLRLDASKDSDKVIDPLLVYHWCHSFLSPMYPLTLLRRLNPLYRTKE